MLLHFFSCAIYIIWCGFSLAVMWFGKSKGRAPPQGTKWATEWARQAYLNTCRDLLIRLQFETVFRERLCLMWAVVLAPFSALCCPSPSSHPVSLLPLHLNSPIPLHDHELWTSLWTTVKSWPSFTGTLQEALKTLETLHFVAVCSDYLTWLHLSCRCDLKLCSSNTK